MIREVLIFVAQISAAVAAAFVASVVGVVLVYSSCYFYSLI